jgi:hypothetical protein
VNAIGKLVVVRFLDKRVLKGRIVDFRPDRDFFHVEEEGAAAATRVEVDGLKAVFFVKTLEGNRDHVEKRAFEERLGTEKKVWIEFTDGERLAGWSNSFASQRAGFYVFPADEDSNMEKAYVFRAAVVRVEEGEAAEAASRAWQAEAQPWGPPVASARGSEALPGAGSSAAREASADGAPASGAGEEAAFAFEESSPADEAPPAANRGAAPFVLDTRPLGSDEESPSAPAVGTYRLGRGAIRSEGRSRGER